MRKFNVQIRFLTNTTKDSGPTLVALLKGIGFELDKSEIFSALSAAAKYVRTSNLEPLYFVSDDARSEFPAESPDAAKNAVVLGYAPIKYNGETLNEAVRLLCATGSGDERRCQLIAIHEAKYFQSEQGLCIGPGCFSRGLQYVSGIQPIVIGKPSRYFFESAVPDGIQFDECVMIGDVRI